MPHADERLAALAARQHGVVARRQLAALGVTPSMVKSRIASGHLIRLHRSVYAVGHARLRREGWWIAAVFAAGPNAALSHRDAAALHGLRPPGDHRVEVTAERTGSTQRIRIHNARLQPSDVTTRDGIRTTTVARTLVDLAAGPPHALGKALEEAERIGALDLQALQDAAERAAHRRGPGHAALKAAVDARAAASLQLTRSALEDRFLALLAAHHIQSPRMNAGLHGYEVDALWPTQRVVVELDGYEFHRTPQAFQRDRTKANDLHAAGYVLLRFTHADVARRPAATAERVAHALASPRRYPPDR